MTHIPDMLTKIVDRVAGVAGVEAVVLGGSRARGTHTATSDVDLGIYYSGTLDVAHLARVAAEIDDSHRENLVTAIGGWGPWINGGGWLTVQQVPVDFLYRDLNKLTQIISDCRAGRIEVAYQPGHPHAFTSAIYFSELALCQSLWDPHSTLAGLKTATQPYPAGLKRAILNTFWWEVDFSLKNAHKSISRGDVAYAAGCCFRGVACLAQTLFALNEQYYMNEKGAVALAAGFPMAPARFAERVALAFTQLEGSAPALSAGIETLELLAAECAPWVAQA